MKFKLFEAQNLRKLFLVKLGVTWKGNMVDLGA